MPRQKSPVSGPLSSYIMEILNNRALSIRTIAAEAKIDYSHLARILRDPKTPSLTPPLLDRIAEALEIPCSPLLAKAGWLGPRSEVPLEKRHLYSLVFTKLPFVFKSVITGMTETMVNIKSLYLEYNYKKIGKQQKVTSTEVDTMFIGFVDLALNYADMLKVDPDELFWVMERLPVKFSDEKHTPYLANKIKNFNNLLNKTSEIIQKKNFSDKNLWKLYYQIKQYGNTEIEDKDISENPLIQVDFRDKYAIITITVPIEKSSGLLPALPTIIEE